MVDLYHGQLTDLLQNGLRNNPDVIAISYAIQQEKQRLLRLEAKTRTMSMIDELDGDILDVLGVELRIPYYSQGFPLERKRSIVKTAMLWFYKAGTAAGMEMALQAIHGDSSVEEWFQYGGNPGYFRVGLDITDPEETLDLKWVRDVVNAYKNIRSHLDDDAIVFRSVQRFVLGVACGFVAYEMPRAGTIPGPATVGALTESMVRIRADPEFVAYSAPKTGEATAGTYPSDATAGATAAGGLRTAITGGGTAYTGPTCGDAEIL